MEENKDKIQEKLQKAQELKSEASRLRQAASELEQEASELCKHESVIEYHPEIMHAVRLKDITRVCDECGLSEHPYAAGCLEYKYKILGNPKKLKSRISMD